MNQVYVLNMDVHSRETTFKKGTRVIIEHDNPACTYKNIRKADESYGHMIQCVHQRKLDKEQ